MRRLVSVVSLMAVLSAAPAGRASPSPERSATPPGWTSKRTVCPPIELADPTHPSGISGPLAGGYNVSVLSIVVRTGIGCGRARQLATEHWTTGRARPFAWRLSRAWRGTSGSAYVADFVGLGAGKRLEYFAIH